VKGRLVAAAVLAVLGFAALASSLAAAEDTQSVYVLSQDDGVLSIIAPSTDEIVARIAIPGKPAAFAIDTASGTAFATLPDAGEVAVINLAGRSVLRNWKIGGQPFGITSDNAGHVFVGDWSAGQLAVVNETTGAVEARLPVGRSPAHLVASSDGCRVYVADRESNSVAVVDTAKSKRIADIPVGRAPFALALSPDQKHLAVANVKDATLSLIDTDSLRVVSSAVTGAMPYGVAITHDRSTILVTNQHGGTVSLLNAQTLATRAEIKVGRYPEGIAILRDGSKAYVANWFSASVSVLDLKTGTEVKRIASPEGPRMVLVDAAAR